MYAVPLPVPATVPPLVYEPLPVLPMRLIVVDVGTSTSHVPFAAVLPPTPLIITVSLFRNEVPVVLDTVQTIGDALVHPLIERLVIVKPTAETGGALSDPKPKRPAATASTVGLVLLTRLSVSALEVVAPEVPEDGSTTNTLPLYRNV